MSAISGSSSSAELSANYMELLVTQMKYQDPSAPMSNEALTQQLATLSQLEQMENLNTTFRELLSVQEIGEANDMIGRVVTFTPSELGETISGLVSGAVVEDGVLELVVGPYTLTYDEIEAVQAYSSSMGNGGGSTNGTDSLIGDLNSDGIVDDEDREILIGNWGAQEATLSMGDLSGDGVIDAVDYDILMEHYGEYLEESTENTTDTEA